jgi:hypothetical protein
VRDKAIGLRVAEMEIGLGDGRWDMGDPASEIGDATCLSSNFVLPASGEQMQASHLLSPIFHLPLLRTVRKSLPVSP